MTGKSHYAPDVRKDPYYVACEAATQSEVAIPLKIGDQVIGITQISGCQETGLFGNLVLV